MVPTRVEISYRTIVFTIFFLVFLWFLYVIRMVLVALFIAVIIMSALNPLVARLEKKKIPRAAAIVIIFALTLFVFAGIIAAIIPPLVDQTKSLVNQIPFILERLGGMPIDQQVISDQLGSVPRNIARFVIGTFSNLIALFTLFVLTFYLLLERGNLHRYLTVFFGSSKTEAKAEEFINKLEHQVGGWVRGQLILMLIIGVMTYIGLRILGISSALPLSIFAGLLEVIPNIGPTVAMIPAVLIASSISPVTALATVALYFLIQQFENNIIVPKVMQKAIGVKPLVIIIALITGVKLAGVLGAILAIPGFLVLKIIIEEIYASGRFQKS
ncbi:AI-2E family transporter [Patescibacteria group bacterium]|nr:AI-2E family transporter [Patescibacteria group bacterium]